MKTILDIFKIQLLITKRNVGKIFNTRDKKLFMLCGIISFLSICFILGSYFIAPILSMSLNGDNRNLYLFTLSSFYNISIVTCASFIVLTFIMPKKNEFYFILRTFHVKACIANFTYFLGILFFGFIAIFTYISVINIPAFIISHTSPYYVLFFYIGALMQFVFMETLMFLLYEFFNLIFKKLKIQYHKSLAELSLLALIIYYCFNTFNFDTLLETYKNFDYNICYLFGGLFNAFFDMGVITQVNYFIIAFITLIVITLLFVIINFNYNYFDQYSIAFLKSIKLNKNIWLNFFLKDLKLFARNEQISISYLLLVILPLFIYNNQDLCTIYAYLASILIPLLGIYSYGLEVNFLDMYKAMNVDIRKITAIKLLSGIVSSCLFWLFIVLVLCRVDMYSSMIFMQLISIMITYVFSYAIGVIYPMKINDPLSGGITFIGSAIILIPLSLLINYTATVSSNIYVLSSLFIIIFGIILSIKLSNVPYRARET